MSSGRRLCRDLQSLFSLNEAEVEANSKKPDGIEPAFRL